MSKRAGVKKDLSKIKKAIAKMAPETKEVIQIMNNVSGNWLGQTNCALGGSTTQALVNVVFNGVINLVAQGPDYTQRLAREIKPYLVEVELFLNGTSSNVAPNPYRLIVYQDRGFNGTTLPDLSNILNGVSSLAGEYQNFMASYNPDYVAHRGDRKNRFKILMDKQGVLGTRGTTPSNLPITRYIKATKYLKNAEVINYRGGAATDYIGGSIFYILLLGTSATAADNASAQVRTRMLFTDS